jgi:hypothetical protein
MKSLPLLTFCMGDDATDDHRAITVKAIALLRIIQVDLTACVTA